MIYEFKASPAGKVCDECFFTLIRFASVRVVQRVSDKGPDRRSPDEAKTGDLSWAFMDLCPQCFEEYIGRWLESAVPDKGKTQVFKYQYVFPAGYQRIVVEEDE